MTPITIYSDTAMVALALGWVVPVGVGAWVSFDARRRVAVARKDAALARSALTAAEALWSNERVTAERDLGKARDDLDAAYAVHERDAKGLEAECERLRGEAAHWREERDASSWKMTRAVASEIEIRAVLDNAYVRVGPAFKRWRADGCYEVAGANDAAPQPATATLTPKFATAGGGDGVGHTGQATPTVEGAGGPEIGVPSTDEAGWPRMLSRDRAQNALDGSEGWAPLPSLTVALSIPVHAIGDNPPPDPTPERGRSAGLGRTGGEGV